MMENMISVRPGFGGFDELYDKARVVFFGVPLDVTSSYRSGTRFAPAKIREASANLETYQMSAGLDVFERLGVCDLGDLNIVLTDLGTTGDRICSVLREVRKDKKIPALLGGEHTLTPLAIREFKDSYLIQLDAHCDLRDEYLGDKLCHATAMRRALDIIPQDRFIQIGVRSCSKEEADFARRSKIQSYTTEQVLENPQKVVEEVAKKVQKRNVYLTIDIDVLDPAFAPAVATPEPGGLSTLDLLRLVRELGELNICAFDVVEVAPAYDTGATAFAAARAIYELLAAMAVSLK
jgi:agmatinase